MKFQVVNIIVFSLFSQSRLTSQREVKFPKSRIPGIVKVLEKLFHQICKKYVSLYKVEVFCEFTSPQCQPVLL